MSPRRKRFRRIGSPPVLKGFKPIGVAYSETDTISILYEEYESLRLADYSGLTHDEAAAIMNVSRPTFTRIYNSCINKLARAFAEGKSIVFEGGDVEFDKQWYRCHDCNLVFHQSHTNDLRCISCNSKNIEHINKSIRDWKQKLPEESQDINSDEYCVCPNCQYEELHHKGVPCFSKTCPECKTSLVRKDR
jgi:predicted DNA-binding protein (UPF0251 family)/rubredoxin